MGKLHTEEIELLQQLRELHVLEDADPSMLDMGNGVIMVACADGDQMHDLYSYQCRECTTHRDWARVHTFALNGGALLLSATSPLTQEHHEDVIFVKQIAGAKLLKSMTSVAMYTHAPCGAAGLAQMSIVDQIRELLRAQDQMNSAVEGLTIVPYMHIDWDGARKRTYRVARARAEEWMKNAVSVPLTVHA